MKRPKFVRVIGVPMPRAGDTHEFRREGDVLAIGTVVPVEWFKTTPDAVFVHLINPPEAGGLGVIEEYEPDIKLLAVLREQYPGAFPTTSPLNPPATQGEIETPAKRKTRSKEEDGE